MANQTSPVIQIKDSNVGIGTTDPSVELVVYSSSTPRLHLQNSTSGTTGTDGFQISLSGTVGYLWNWENGATLFGTNNAERMRITGAGNVGIGTTSPAYKLDINGSFNALTSGVYLTYNSGVLYHGDYYQFPSGSYYYLYGRAGMGLIFGSNNAEVGRFDLSGNLGIGTTSPVSLLHVNGLNNTTPLTINAGSNAAFEFKGNSTSGYTTTFNINDTALYIGHNSASRNLVLQTASSDRVTITGAGNVGIGTTSPSVKLHTVGDGLFYSNTNTNLTVNSNGGAATLTLTNGAGSQLIYGGVGGSNNMDFYTGSTFRMRIDPSGNVGIGTTAPNFLLTLDKNSSYTLGLLNSNIGTPGQYTGLTFGYTGTTYQKGAVYFISKDANGVGDLVFALNNVASSANVSTSDERLRITSTGNVGIGTTSPSAKLHVIGNATVSATLSTANAKITGTLADSFNQVGTAGQVLSSTGTGIEWVTGGGGGGTTITVKDEGTTVSSAISTLDFYGENVQATATGSTATIAIRNNAGTGSQYLNDLVTPYVIPGSYVDTVNINGVDIIVPAPGESKTSETLTAILTFGILNVTGSDRFNAFYFRLYNNTTAAEISDTQHRWSSYMSVDDPSTIATFHIPIKLNEISMGDDIYVQCQTSVVDAPEIYYCALTFIKGSN